MYPAKRRRASLDILWTLFYYFIKSLKYILSCMLSCILSCMLSNTWDAKRICRFIEIFSNNVRIIMVRRILRNILRVGRYEVA